MFMLLVRGRRGARSMEEDIMGCEGFKRRDRGLEPVIALTN